MNNEKETPQIMALISLLQENGEGYQRVLTDMEYSILKYLENEALQITTL